LNLSNIKKWADKYKISYVSKRGGQTDNEYIKKQRQMYFDDIKKKFF